MTKKKKGYMAQQLDAHRREASSGSFANTSQELRDRAEAPGYDDDYIKELNEINRKNAERLEKKKKSWF